MSAPRGRGTYSVTCIGDRAPARGSARDPHRCCGAEAVAGPARVDSEHSVPAHGWAQLRRVDAQREGRTTPGRR